MQSLQAGAAADSDGRTVCAPAGHGGTRIACHSPGMDVQTLLPILLSWAVHLSDYPMPETAPEVRFETHAFFVVRVCGGRECNAVGWYNDEDVIHLDEKFLSADNAFASSLLVHELVHYLQHRSGRFDSLSCEHSREREREAYRVQNEFILEAQSSFALIRPAPTTCSYAHAATAAHLPAE